MRPTRPTVIVSGPYSGWGDPQRGWGSTLGAPKVLDILDQYAPIFRDVAGEFSDPGRQVASLRQRLATAISKGKPAAVVLELQEKLRDAEADLAKEQEYDDSKRELNTLSKIAVVTGIGIGASVIFFVLMRALK